MIATETIPSNERASGERASEARTANESFDGRIKAHELGSSLALSTLFGVATAHGLSHAHMQRTAWQLYLQLTLSIPLMLCVVVGIALPSLFVALTLSGADLSIRKVWHSALEAISVSARMLASCSPLMLLYAATTPSASSAPIKLLSFALVGMSTTLGIGRIAWNRNLLEGTRGVTPHIAMIVFCIFSLLLVARIFTQLAFI